MLSEGKKRTITLLIVNQYNLLPHLDMRARIKVWSETEPEKYYIVEQNYEYVWKCSCPAGHKGLACKHLRKLGLPFNEPFQIPIITEVEWGQILLMIRERPLSLDLTDFVQKID
jgi:predicted nucleic acid-binding Zn finger protein